MSLRIIKSGIQDTIQDIGRYGYAKWGINPGGAMDSYAAQVANGLVGNEVNEGVIEIHFPALQILFQQDVLIGLTGGDFTPYINSVEIPLWKPIGVKKDSVLSFHKRKKGNRCYFAVHGGFKIPRWLGSVSTNIKSNVGGLNGNALKKGDVIFLNNSNYPIRTLLKNDFQVLPWSVNFSSEYTNPNDISFIQGNEWAWLTEESQHQFMTSEFKIEMSSDRMGCYLVKTPLEYQSKQELVSSAVTFGTIQGLPDGRLVVLMADHQTTGGYPRIGHVITAHLPKLAQLGANDLVRLNKISIDASEKMLFSLQENLLIIKESCRTKLSQYYAQR